MEQTAEIMMKLIGSEVCGGTLCLPSGVVVTDELLSQLFEVSKTHNVAHLVGSALINNNLLFSSAYESAYREQVYAEILRSEKLNYVFEKICSVLEKERISYIPLKGAVVREMYPQPWMRTSCDIDILVHKEDLDNASKAITDSLGYVQSGKGKHDVSVLSTENIFIELHFSLLEDSLSSTLAKVLGEVWEHSKPVENGSCRFRMDDEMFYFYHIAHMAKHFINGGCGLRPFVDLWLMEHSRDYHTPEADALLKKGKLLAFAETASQLSQVWLSGEEHNEITVLMQDFILTGGCFGSVKTKMLSKQQRSGGNFKYILSRVFVPYDDLKGQYPILKKHRFLTPVFEFCRLFSLMFGRKKDFRKKYMGGMNVLPEEQLEGIGILFEKVGLHKLR